MTKQESIPLVTIITLTYNHVSYISECLEGLLNQQTTFPFEVIVHDDASIDKTTSIIRKYELKYPHLIKPIYQSVNQYRNGSILKRFCYPKARGKYIAFCEGDDYWIDPFKLQKQIDFLEENTDYNLVYTNYRKYNQLEERFVKSNPKIAEGEVYEALLTRRIHCQHLTVCTRKESLLNLTYPNFPKDYFQGDWMLYLLLSQHGKFKYLPDVTGVYRLLSDSASHFTSKKKERLFNGSCAKMALYFWNHKPIRKSLRNYLSRKRQYVLLTKAALVSGNYEDMDLVEFKHCLFGNPLNTLLIGLSKKRTAFHLLSERVYSK
ncbi:MAG: glycosyltransferase family 2 protein [Phocaeicola sp.]